MPDDGLFYAAGRDVTESRRAAEEQAALRRVATLVAQEATPDTVFAAVAREVGEVLAVRVLRSGSSARMDGYEDAPGVIAETIRQMGLRFSIGVPVPVPGRTWGVMIATSSAGRCRPRNYRCRLGGRASRTRIECQGGSGRAAGELRIRARRPPAARRADHQVESNMPGRGTGAISRTAGTVGVSGGGGWLQR